MNITTASGFVFGMLLVLLGVIDMLVAGGHEQWFHVWSDGLLFALAGISTIMDQLLICELHKTIDHITIVFGQKQNEQNETVETTESKGE